MGLFDGLLGGLVGVESIWQPAHERLDESRAMYLRSPNGQVWVRPVNGIDAKYLLSGLAT